MHGQELTMLDPDTFLTTVYVMADTFCKTLPLEPQPGGSLPSLSRSEVLTLALFGQWAHFQSERDFYRYAERHLRPAFPALPDRAQFNRLLRSHRDALSTFAIYLADQQGARAAMYEALDCSGVPTRNAKRRGAGWLAGITDIGWSNRLGWYEGLHMLMAVTPNGIITGFGFGAASTKDQPLADTFFALRQHAEQQLPSVGHPAAGPYVADTGFEGAANHVHWAATYHAQVICPPRRTSHQPWSAAWRRWHASVRQIVETVYDKLHYTFRLVRERPHDLTGFQARLAAKVALHNFCIWINVQLGRERLAFADLIDW
jgi:hypothetical protein